MRYKIDAVPCKNKETKKRLYLSRYSCPASDPKKNILLIHGLTFTQHVFDINYKDYSLMRYLCKQGYTAWALDIGGHGRSQRFKNGFDVNTATATGDTIEALRVMCEEQEVESVDLLGWSWGTIIAAAAAGQASDLVRKLLLVGPATGGTIPAMPPEMFPNDKEMIPYEFAARLFRHLNAASGAVNEDEDDEIDYDVTEPEVVNLAMHNLVRYDLTDPKPQGPNVELMGAGDKWLIDTEPIKCPTLFVKGTDDIYSTDERVDALVAKCVEGSGKYIIRGGGHGMYYEKDYYHEFQKVMIEFLEK